MLIIFAEPSLQLAAWRSGSVVRRTNEVTQRIYTLIKPD